VRDSGSYLNAHEKNLADQNYDCAIVGILLKIAVGEDILLNDREEYVHEILERLSLLIDFKFKSLNQAL